MDLSVPVIVLRGSADSHGLAYIHLLWNLRIVRQSLQKENDEVLVNSTCTHIQFDCHRYIDHCVRDK